MFYAIFGLPALQWLAGKGIKWAANKLAKDQAKPTDQTTKTKDV